MPRHIEFSDEQLTRLAGLIRSSIGGPQTIVPITLPRNPICGNCRHWITTGGSIRHPGLLCGECLKVGTCDDDNTEMKVAYTFTVGGESSGLVTHHYFGCTLHEFQDDIDSHPTMS